MVVIPTEGIDEATFMRLCEHMLDDATIRAILIKCRNQYRIDLGKAVLESRAGLFRTHAIMPPEVARRIIEAAESVFCIERRDIEPRKRKRFWPWGK